MQGSQLRMILVQRTAVSALLCFYITSSPSKLQHLELERSFLQHSTCTQYSVLFLRYFVTKQTAALGIRELMLQHSTCTQYSDSYRAPGTTAATWVCTSIFFVFMAGLGLTPFIRRCEESLSHKRFSSRMQLTFHTDSPNTSPRFTLDASDACQVGEYPTRSVR